MIPQIIKDNWASIARWAGNAIAGKFLLDGGQTEQLVSALVILGTLAWTVLENKFKKATAIPSDEKH